MKEFTKEMLDKLQDANDKLKGSSKYSTYYMECDAKTNNRWHFIGNYLPYRVGKFKTVKDKTYIITEDSDSNLTRYVVTDEVKELLNI